jgi:hypothetical protein
LVPLFTNEIQEKMSWISVNIDLDDFYNELSSKEKNELVDLLTEDGLIDENYTPPPKQEDRTYGEIKFRESVLKLLNGYYQLTIDDIELLTKIVNKI